MKKTENKYGILQVSEKNVGLFYLVVNQFGSIQYDPEHNVPTDFLNGLDEGFRELPLMGSRRSHIHMTYIGQKTDLRHKFYLNTTEG